MTRRPLFELLLEKLQIINVHVRNSPVVKVRVSPVQKLIPLACYRFRSFRFVRRCWPNKKVDKVFAPSVNQRRHWPVIQIIKASANQGKTITGEVHHRSCKIELRIKPRFNSVLVGRSYIREMVRHDRANMARYKLRRKELIGIWLPQPRQQAGSVSCDPAGWLLASRTQVEDCLPTGFDDDRYSDVDVRR